MQQRLKIGVSVFFIFFNQNRNDTSGPTRNDQKTERCRQAFIPDDDIGQAETAVPPRVANAPNNVCFWTPPTTSFIKMLSDHDFYQEKRVVETSLSNSIRVVFGRLSRFCQTSNITHSTVQHIALGQKHL
jgi:hypothetical protein